MVRAILKLVNSFERISIAVFLLFTTSCSQATPIASPETFKVQYSFAAQPWLATLNICAGNKIVLSNLLASDYQDLKTANLVIHIGHPDNLTDLAYKLGTDDLLVIVNPQNPVKKLSADQVRGIFTGRFQTWTSVHGSNRQIRVWVFPAGEDVQQIFEETILARSSPASMARLASSPDEMSQAVSNDPDAIGLITARRKTGTTTDVFTAGSNLPVLAITQFRPQGILAQILACMQK
jgi:PBP superfamily domain